MRKYLDRNIHSLAIYYNLYISEEDFEKELKLLKVKERPTWLRDTAMACVHRLSYGEKKIAAVCMRKRPDTSREGHYTSLVHEAVHIWQWHKEIIGEKEPSAEFEAYAIDSIASELMKSFRDQTRRKKR